MPLQEPIREEKPSSQNFQINLQETTRKSFQIYTSMYHVHKHFLFSLLNSNERKEDFRQILLCLWKKERRISLLKSPPIMHRQIQGFHYGTTNRKQQRYRLLENSIWNSKTVHRTLSHSWLKLEYQSYESLSFDKFRGSLPITLSSTIL